VFHLEFCRRFPVFNFRSEFCGVNFQFNGSGLFITSGKDEKRFCHYFFRKKLCKILLLSLIKGFSCSYYLSSVTFSGEHIFHHFSKKVLKRLILIHHHFLKHDLLFLFKVRIADGFKTFLKNFFIKFKSFINEFIENRSLKNYQVVGCVGIAASTLSLNKISYSLIFISELKGKMFTKMSKPRSTFIFDTASARKIDKYLCVRQLLSILNNRNTSFHIFTLTFTY